MVSRCTPISSFMIDPIIQIEAKRANTDTSRSSATKQLGRGQTFFEENFPFPSSENWNYTKMMCFGESVEKEICYQCNFFAIATLFN
jgi:hypothetical protein